MIKWHIDYVYNVLHVDDKVLARSSFFKQNIYLLQLLTNVSLGN